MTRNDSSGFDGRIKYYFTSDLDASLAEMSRMFLARPVADLQQFNIVRRKPDRIVFKEEAHGKIYYIKLFLPGNRKKICINYFYGSPGLRNYKTLVLLNDCGVHTVKPVLAAVKAAPFWAPRSLCITEDFRGIPLAQFLCTVDSEADRRNVLDEFIQLYSIMLNNNFYQKDPALTNFLVRNNTVAMMDVDLVPRLPFRIWPVYFNNLIHLNKFLILGAMHNSTLRLDDSDRRDILYRILKNVRKDIRDLSLLLERLEQATEMRMAKEGWTGGQKR